MHVAFSVYILCGKVSCFLWCYYYYYFFWGVGGPLAISSLALPSGCLQACLFSFKMLMPAVSFYFFKKNNNSKQWHCLIKHQRQSREQILQRQTMAVYRIPRAFLLSRCIYLRSDAPGPGRRRGVRAVGVQCALYLPGAGSWVRRWQHCLSSTCSKQRPKPVRVRLRLCANCR